MMKTAIAMFGTLAMLTGAALASPPPNTATGVGEGGGVYYNPNVARQRAQQQSLNRQTEVGAAWEGGAAYHVPTNGQRG
jgi:hypothetical protein